jgi:type II secretory pathway pseudopilin PulG
MLTVLAIIGVIAMIIMPLLIRARFKSDMTACLALEKRITQGLETRRNEKGEYPDNLQTLKDENYLPTAMPVCPSNGESYINSYEVRDDKDCYTLSCPGIHYKLLNVKQGYPQYTSTSGLNLGEK